VPGLTDDRDDLTNIARFAASLGTVERVEVLPFHQMGKFKWERLGLPYSLATVQPPTPQATEQVCELFRREGLLAY
jgi:pyruvate formate lyase activating enzyme